MMTSAKSETREENTPEKRLLDVALHTFKLQSYNITARTSTTKPQTALTNPKLAAEALVVVGVVTVAISASLASSTAVSIIDSSFCQHYCMSHVIANLSTPARHCTTHTHSDTLRCNRNKWCLCGPSKCIFRKSHVKVTFFYVFFWNSILEPNFCIRVYSSNSVCIAYYTIPLVPVFSLFGTLFA